MGRETKIGLAVIGVLLLVFGALLFRKLAGSTAVGPAAEETAGAVARPLTSAGMADKPSIVLSQKNATTQPASDIGPGRERHGESTEVPAAVYMPSEEVADTSSQAEQYRRQDAATNDEAGDPDRSPQANPFPGRSHPRGTDNERRNDGPGEAPRRLPETPGKASQGDARDERSSRTARNPLRRVSAEEPLQEGTPGADVVTAGGDIAVPDGDAPRTDGGQDSGIPAGDPPGSAPHLAAVRPLDRHEVPLATDSDIRQGAAQTQWQRGGVEPAAATGNEPVVAQDGKYTIQPNDNLWIISEKVYGNSRYFKAIHEHNRSRLPHADHLTVGTVIAVPPATLLEQNYPSLCPKQRHSAVIKPRTLPASSRQQAPRGENAYVVEEGDTLFDIARYELGKASRWSEIYDLNREVLGQDFDYLQPGTELAMPPKAQTPESFTRGRDPRYQR